MSIPWLAGYTVFVWVKEELKRKKKMPTSPQL